MILMTKEDLTISQSLLIDALFMPIDEPLWLAEDNPKKRWTVTQGLSEATHCLRQFLDLSLEDDASIRGHDRVDRSRNINTMDYPTYLPSKSVFNR